MKAWMTTYVKIDLNGARGTRCLEIIGPTTSEENLTVHDVAASDIVYITNPSYNFYIRSCYTGG